SGSPIVVQVGIDCGPVGVDAAVGIQGESEERGGPVPSGEDLPNGAFVDGSAGQIRGVLAAPGGALDRFGCGVKGSESAADSGGAQCGVEFGDRVGDLFTADLIAVVFAFGIRGQQIRPRGHQLRVLLAG